MLQQIQLVENYLCTRWLHVQNLLFIATEDFIHQKFRQEAMPKSFALLNKLRGAGVAAFISGSGPISPSSSQW